MEAGYVNRGRRGVTCALCLMMCAAGVYSCLTHLTIYLDVEIFELNLLIEDLIIFAGYVLMTVGAFRVNRVLSVLGVAVVASQRVAGLCTDSALFDSEYTAAEICTLVLVEAAEIIGLFLGAVFILTGAKVIKALKPWAKKLWFLPAVFLAVSFVGYLFTNIGPLTDTAAGRFLLGLATVSTVVWCTDPEGIPRWISERLRANEEAEN